MTQAEPPAHQDADSGSPAAPALRAPASGEAGLTCKSTLAGLLGVTAIGLYSNTNDRVLHLSPLIGNHMPVGAFAFVLLLAVLWNPSVGRLHRVLRFGTRELAVVLGMMLICSWIPGSSFYRYFHYQIIVPWIDASAHPEWSKQGTLAHLPARLYPLAHDAGAEASERDGGSPEQQRARQDYERVYLRFRSGIPTGDRQLALTEAPYREWLPTTRYWFPLVLSMALCLIALIWLLHRQWAHHEQLSYPIAAVSTALIARSGDRLTSDIFYSRLFWGGFAPVFLIHSINYLNAWFPAHVPRIPLAAWVWDWHNPQLFPILDKTGTIAIENIQIFFSVFGLAYFVPSEISLSMGLCTVCLTLVGAVSYQASGTPLSGDDKSGTLAGAYLGYFAILLYTGRSYYAHVLARAFALRPVGAGDVQQVWAARLFLIFGALFVWCLWAFMDLDWFMALLFGASLIVYFLVFARIIAETGVPMLQANFDTGWTLCQIMGFPAVGPGAIVMMVYLGGVLNPDARECITPYVANTLKMAETVGVRVPRLIGVAAAATVFALVLGFAATTYSLYDHGAKEDYAASQANLHLDQSTRGLSALRETGLSDRSRDTHGLAKLSLIPKNGGHGRVLGWMAFGIVGVLALSFMRFRFASWPFHPVIFLMWGTWTATLVWISFLLGWAVKVAIVRYGGGRQYNQLKPLFIGMIMGEIVVVAMILAVGFVYYMVTGLVPRNTGVFPG